MEIIVAITTGVLFGAGIYMLLRRSVTKLVIGIILLSNATNLLLFVAAGLKAGKPAIIPEGDALPETMPSDPVPQALILTAIVISLGIIAFTLALQYVHYISTGKEDLDKAKETDR